MCCTMWGVCKAYEAKERRGSVKPARTGRKRGRAGILSDGERRGGNAAPASQVFSKFWVIGRHKKKKTTTFFHFKSTINRKQSRV